MRINGPVVPLTPFSDPRTFVMSVNIPITALKAPVATITFLVSKKLNSVIIPAIAINGTVIFISIVPALSALAPADLDILIMSVITPINADIARVPLTISPTETPAKTLMATARTPIPTDIFISILPAAEAFLPAYCDTLTIAANNNSQEAMTAIPLTISPPDSPAISLIVKARIPIAADILRIIDPAFEALSPADFDTSTKDLNNTAEAAMTAPPLITSFVSIVAISLIVKANIPIAIDILSNIFPALSAFSPASNDTAISLSNRMLQAVMTANPLEISPADRVPISFMTNANIPIATAILVNILPALSALKDTNDNTDIAANNNPQAPNTAIPLTISPTDIVPINLITNAKIPKLTDSFRNIFPALSILPAASAFTNTPKAIMTPAMAAIRSDNSNTAPIPEAKSTPANFFKANDMINIEADIANMRVPSLANSNLPAGPLTFSLTFIKAINPAPRTVTTATAFHSLPISTVANATNESASIPIAFAKLSKYSDLRFLVL